MAWFSSSSRPLRTVEFYQEKVLRFLFSAEGKEDFRCLNIPVSQLGFYSPVHFLSCIPSKMCEPFRNDKLFLATSGEIRKGDRVLLVQDTGDGEVVQSAIFKGRRIGRSGEPEILLNGHRKSYTEEEVVPYKAYLRDQLSTALVPEEEFVISEDGILEWEEPTWEPGQEVLYKNSHWGVIVGDELSPRGRIIVTLKLEPTNFKREKIVKIPLDELKANAVPLRVPFRKPRKSNSVDDIIQKVNEEFKEIYQADMERDRVKHESGQSRDETMEVMKVGEGATRSATEKKHVKYSDEEAASSSAKSNGYAVVLKKDDTNAKMDGGRMRENTPTPEVKEHEYATMTRKEKDREQDKGGTPVAQSVLRPKRSKKTKERPHTEYISSDHVQYAEIQKPQQQPPLPERNKVKRDVMREEAPKFKSCNNLTSGQYSDDDLEPFELMNYTNSLRSSARKIIQRQMAESSGNKSSSLKLRHATSSKPHVTEVFSWNDDAGRMTRRTSETTAVTQKRKETRVDDDLPPARPQRHVPASTTTATPQRHVPATTTTTSKMQMKSPSPQNYNYPGRTTPVQNYYPVQISQTQNQVQRMTVTESRPMMAKSPSPVPPLIRRSTPSPNSSNNLNKSLSQPDIRRDVLDSAKKPSAHPVLTQGELTHHPPKPPTKSKSQNPLDYEFAPLSSSELVKKQLAIVNRVLHEPQFKGGVLYQDYLYPKGSSKNGKGFHPDEHSTKVLTCASSDSSSQDNDSGRGSYQFNSENVKGMEELVGVDHVLDTRNSPSKYSYVMTPTEESVYANENMTIYSQNGNHQSQNQNAAAEEQNRRESSPTRRYIKNNRSCSRNSAQRYNGAMEDNDSEEEFTLPLPFSPSNLTPVAGFGRGIHGTENSSFADATLYALFACSNIFDQLLLFSKPGLVEKGIKRDVRRILRDKIVLPLRTSAYCKAENVTHLREAMLPLSSKMHSSLMDAEEFLYLLFDSALNTESFIEFSNGTKDFMHQIIARPKDRSKSQTVQFMLETSLGTSELKFKGIPQPALFLCMPRCKGRLVYYEAIIPTLQLNVTRLLHKGPKQCVCEMAATLECMICHQKNGDLALDFCQTCKAISDQVHFRLDHDPVLVPKRQRDEILNLHSIICTRGNRYVSFVKVSEQKFSPWLYFDPLVGEYPEVTLLEDFGKWLDSLEKQPGHYREFSKLHPLLKKIMTDSHIYIYSKRHMVEGTEPHESMRI